MAWGAKMPGKPYWALKLELVEAVMAFYRRDPRVLAVMVELNKRLYLPPELW